MKIFLDTANVANIEKWAATGLIDGITTNPSHLSKEKTDPKKIILDICKLLPEGHISVEVTQQEPDAVYKQAKQIAALAENIWVKIPCHPQYFPVIKKLVEEEVKINITLVFTLLQCLMMCKLGVYYISPFIGRLDDIEADGMAFIPHVRDMIDFYGFETKLLVASIRSVQNFHDAVIAGADAITVPVDVFEKSLNHPLTDQGMQKFENDWQKLGVNHFP